jgi:translation initiation factor 4A
MSENEITIDSPWGEIANTPISAEKKIGKPINTENENSDDKKNVEIKYYESFDEMSLKENLLRGIFGYGFETPSKIQKCCISIISARHDLIAQSQAGTGKTGAFACGTLQVVNENENYAQAIIMSPTRELSTQIDAVVNDLGKFMKIKTVLCLGGTNVELNVKETKHAHIIIGTPGRIYDLIERRAIDSKRIKILIMDEADVLLSREFVSQSKNIITKLSQHAQICAFSATLPEEVVGMMHKFMNKPINILIQREKLTLDVIAQYYIDVIEDKYKLDVLDDMYRGLSIGQCIIYVNFKDKAKWLQEKLTELGHAVEAIHSDLTPLERTNIMKQFRSGIYRVLISTDLLARGIDVQQVGYVINYDLPHDTDCYLHRIGRSGRYGKKGVAINFVTKRDKYLLRNIRDKFRVSIEAMPEPQYLNDYLLDKIES